MLEGTELTFSVERLLAWDIWWAKNLWRHLKQEDPTLGMLVQVQGDALAFVADKDDLAYASVTRIQGMFEFFNVAF